MGDWNLGIKGGRKREGGKWDNRGSGNQEKLEKNLQYYYL